MRIYTDRRTIYLIAIIPAMIMAIGFILMNLAFRASDEEVAAKGIIIQQLKNEVELGKQVIQEKPPICVAKKRKRK